MDGFDRVSWPLPQDIPRGLAPRENSKPRRRVDPPQASSSCEAVTSPPSAIAGTETDHLDEKHSDIE